MFMPKKKKGWEWNCEDLLLIKSNKMKNHAKTN